MVSGSCCGAIFSLDDDEESIRRSARSRNTCREVQPLAVVALESLHLCAFRAAALHFLPLRIWSTDFVLGRFFREDRLFRPHDAVFRIVFRSEVTSHWLSWIGSIITWTIRWFAPYLEISRCLGVLVYYLVLMFDHIGPGAHRLSICSLHVISAIICITYCIVKVNSHRMMNFWLKDECSEDSKDEKAKSRR